MSRLDTYIWRDLHTIYAQCTFIYFFLLLFFFIPFANCTTTNKRQTAKQITKYEVKRQHLFRYLHSDDMHRLSDHFICYCFVFCAFIFFRKWITLNVWANIELHTIAQAEALVLVTSGYKIYEEKWMFLLLCIHHLRRIRRIYAVTIVLCLWWQNEFCVVFGSISRRREENTTHTMKPQWRLIQCNEIILETFFIHTFSVLIISLCIEWETLEIEGSKFVS